MKPSLSQAKTGKQDILCLHFDLDTSQGCHPSEDTRREAPTKDDILQTGKQDILCLHFDLHAFQGCHPFEVTRREAPTKDDILQTANRTPQECCHTEKIVAI